jgi:adenine-specific DNA-methyltransferase
MKKHTVENKSLPTRFKQLLIHLFRINNADLNFGIYRILNAKAKEVNEFIEYGIDKTLEDLKKTLINRQVGKNDIERTVTDVDNLEKSVYQDLYRFFERYYDNGDFISKPRSGKNNYMLPHEGEEVNFYWANHDQYFVKSCENYAHYQYSHPSSDGKHMLWVDFRLMDAEISLNNNKEQKGRLFIPATHPFEWDDINYRLTVKFFHKVPSSEEKKIWGDKQSVKSENKGINQRLTSKLREFARQINNTDLLLLAEKTKDHAKGAKVPLFLFHLDRFTSVNKADYFIHKDLKGFLCRELDFFLKNDVLNLNFLDTNHNEHEVSTAIHNNFARAAAIKKIALEVIYFLSELEDFQKRMLEKRKFVIDSNYCLTLDRIPETIYSEIIEYILLDSSKKQINEWIALGFISGNELHPDVEQNRQETGIPFSFSYARQFLRDHTNLLIDTAWLPKGLKWKLLSSIGQLDKNTSGLLICSDNMQALNVLQHKYHGKVAASYIDPPYNTGDDGFPYKDGFKSSTWIAMMNDRLRAAKKLLSKDGLQFIHIDFHELNHLYLLCNKIYGDSNFVSMFNVKVRHEGRILKADKDTHEVMEQVLAYKTNASGKGLNKERVDNTSIDDYVYEVNFVGNPSEVIEVDGWPVEVYKANDYEIVKSNMPSALNTKSIDIRGTIMQGNSTGRIYTNYLKGMNFPAGTLFKVIGMGNDHLGYRAIKTPEGKKKNATYYQGVPKDRQNEKEVPYCTFLDFEKAFNNARKETPIDFNNGKKPLIFLQRFIEFSQRSDNDIFLDFFGGSGSWGHAVINYNKTNNTQHKFIVIEMADYFYYITLPTIKKATYATRWQDQEPVNDGGLSQIFQYIKLEQYEDTLNNIDLSNAVTGLPPVDNIRYLFTHGTAESASLVNLEMFTKPFDYRMTIIRQNEPIENTSVDLITTFNFLLGIEVDRYYLEVFMGVDYYSVEGNKGTQKYLIIWRDYNELTIDLLSEKEFIISRGWYNKTAKVFCNGDNGFGAHPIEPEFIRLMNQPID